MSERYPGGFMTQSPPTPSASNTTGVWTLDQQQQLQQAGQWPANGPFWIEDVFQTWLYTGNGTSQTINNGIDLAGKGGLVWIKARSVAESNQLVDTVRGNTKYLVSNNSDAEDTITTRVTSFNANGFSLGSHSIVNGNGNTFASWTFREQPKFFDVVTYTGNGAAPRNIPHNLGSTPGCILIKCTNTTGDWFVWHRSMTSTTSNYLVLNSTAAQASGFFWPNGVTDTYFSVNGGLGNINTNGNTYVAYLFAHDAGGFGLTGTDNVITCGSFTTDGSENSTTNLGYEPQWLLLKATAGGTAGSQPWHIFDSMRGLTVAGRDDASLQPNNANAESQVNRIGITSTGFTTNAFGANTTFIYIAIRRGPMRTPTTGTSVYAPVSYSGTGTTNFISSGFVVDAEIVGPRTVVRAWKSAFASRLTGTGRYLTSSSTAVEQTDGPAQEFASNTGVLRDGTGMNSTADSPLLTYMLQRAPGFFDVVCYTGTGSARTITHNLAAVPELMLVKQRTASPAGTPFAVYSATMGNTGIMFLNSDGGNQGPDTQWNSTTPTASVFSVGSSLEVNQSGSTYVAYLFASCPGVSRVGSYTGTGTTQVINCGFTAGSRFVMIKRVGTGDWYVWDSARGIVAGNDPYLLLNSTAAEVTNTDFVDTAATGFEISSTAPAAINANGGTFIFLAIA